MPDKGHLAKNKITTDTVSLIPRSKSLNSVKVTLSIFHIFKTIFTHLLYIDEISINPIKTINLQPNLLFAFPRVHFGKKLHKTKITIQFCWFMYSYIFFFFSKIDNNMENRIKIYSQNSEKKWWLCKKKENKKENSQFSYIIYISIFSV